MKAVKNPGKESGCPGGEVNPGDLVCLKAEFNYGVGIALWTRTETGPYSRRLWRCRWTGVEGREVIEWDELEENLEVLQAAAKCFGGNQT